MRTAGSHGEGHLVSPAARVWLLTAALVVVATVLTATVLAPLPVLPTPTDLPWWAFALVFAVTEVVAVHVHLRQDTYTLSLSEIPLVVGLIFLSPLELVAARVTGSMLALLGYERQALAKLVFNVALHALEACAAVLLFRWLLGEATAVDVRGWVASFVGTTAAVLVGHMLVVAVIWMHTGRMQRLRVRELAMTVPASAVVNASLGVLAATVMWFQVTAAWLLAALVGIGVVAYRSHAGLRAKHATQSQVHEFARTVATAGSVEEIVDVLLTQSLRVFGAESAACALPADAYRRHPAEVARVGDGPVWRRELSAEEFSELVALLPEGSPSLVLARSSGPGVRHELLARRALRDAMVVRVAIEDDVTGVLIVGDRLGDVATFAADDAALCETLANQAGVALRNQRLVDRLRLEALDKERLALTDGLTGLANRTQFQRWIDAAVVADQGEGVAVLLLDLDRFKEVNDTLGHEVGDRLLCQIGARLSQEVGGGGRIARLGGDEFAVMLAPATDETARAMAARLHAVLASGFEVQQVVLDARASVGVAVFPKHGHDAAVLLRKADVAMYVAKDAGHHTAVYTPDRDRNSPAQLTLITELRRGIDAGELTVHYQPKCAVRTGRPVGVEALVRWQHPVRGLVPPDSFVPVAEQTRLMGPLTRYVLRSALAQCRGWALAGLHLPVAVNLSAHSLLDDQLPSDLETLLSEAGLDARLLTLELTESSLMVDMEREADVLARLTGMGVRLSIDDFGTGYSSLTQLRRLQADEIKVDRSFVTHMVANEHDAVIVRSTIDLGRSLGLQVVAEGVEDEATWSMLREMGCDVAQGYLLSRPIAAARIEDWLVAWEAAAIHKQWTSTRP